MPASAVAPSGGSRGGGSRPGVHVAAEHFGIGQQVVAEGNGLGNLQMGEARHDGAGVFKGATYQGVAQLAQVLQVVDFRRAATGSVATWSLQRTAGVQALARVAHQFHQALMFRCTSFLQIQQPLVLPASISQGPGSCHAGCRPGLRTDDALGGQHVSVCASEPLMSGAVALVEIHGRRIAFDDDTGPENRDQACALLANWF